VKEEEEQGFTKAPEKVIECSLQSHRKEYPNVYYIKSDCNNEEFIKSWVEGSGLIFALTRQLWLRA